MIFDLDKSHIISKDGYDLCIVGSGPAGMAIALEFLRTDKKILVIESGGKTINKKTSKLTNYDNVGLSYTNPNMQRARVLGGSSYFGEAIIFRFLDVTLKRADQDLNMISLLVMKV